MPFRYNNTRFRQAVAGAVLAAFLFSLSGCVYLRLLRFKNQLRDFDEHIEVVSEPGLSLHLRHPVLEDGDFVFLTDSQPTERIELSQDPKVELWKWRFHKRQPEERETREFSMVFDTRFENEMLTRIAFDPALLSVLPEEFVITLFRSMGKASINKFRRSATATMKGEDLADVSLPTLRQIAEVMGRPTKYREDDGDTIWHYDFDFKNPETGENAGEFSLSFRAASDDLDREIAGFTVTGSAR